MKSRFFLVLSLCLCFVSNAVGQENSGSQIPAINYCDIIENPQPYNEKIVKIFAEWSTGFEFSGLGSQNCAEKYGRIWVEWEKYESCGDEKTARLLINRDKGIEYNYLEGVFVGKFFVKENGKSGFGHMNAKPFKLTVSCVESAALLPKENAGCARVDETSPFHYLEYVKTEPGIAPRYKAKRKEGKKENLVWFRLVNNSSCPIIIPTAENRNELQNEAETAVIYRLDPAIRTSRSTEMPRGGAVRTISDAVPVRSVLSGGNSIYFAVPLRFFKERFKVSRDRKISWNISVPFEYADRKKDENYDPFYFSNSDLPKEILR